MYVCVCVWFMIFLTNLTILLSKVGGQEKDKLDIFVSAIIFNYMLFCVWCYLVIYWLPVKQRNYLEWIRNEPRLHDALQTTYLVFDKKNCVQLLWQYCWQHCSRIMAKYKKQQISRSKRPWQNGMNQCGNLLFQYFVVTSCNKSFHIRQRCSYYGVT